MAGSEADDSTGLEGSSMEGAGAVNLAGSSTLSLRLSLVGSTRSSFGYLVFSSEESDSSSSSSASLSNKLLCPSPSPFSAAFLAFQ